MARFGRQAPKRTAPVVSKVSRPVRRQPQVSMSEHHSSMMSAKVALSGISPTGRGR